MRVPRSWLLLPGILALTVLPAAARAQAVGSEFQVNTHTTGDQTTYSRAARQLAAADASGNFVIVWTSVDFQDGDSSGVFGQRYDSAGEALGAEFQVNSFTTQAQRLPSVAAAADGAFVVVWQSIGQDGSGYGVFGQRYDSAGTAQGGEFRVNSYTTLHQNDPSVAADAAGNFVVVWGSEDQDGSRYGIFGQRFDSSGVPRGAEFRVNSYTTRGQRWASVASDTSGNFVVVWGSIDQDGSEYGIFGQRYDSAGVALGGEFRVNSHTTARQWYSSVAADAGGNFVVVWTSNLQDGSLHGIFGQRYDSAGEAQGGEFRVNTHTPSTQRFPTVASDASGNFLVVWENTTGGNALDVSAQRYDSAGVAQGGEFQVNAFTRDHQYWASVAATGTNQFVVAWVSTDGRDTPRPGQDGSGSGVFGQRYDFGFGTPTIHAGDLDGRARNVGASWRAQVTTRVHDFGHGPISAALATLHVSGVGTRTCTTTPAGVCEVGVVVPDSVPSVTFTVTNLAKAGFSYDAGANHDPDPDSNGTVIVVNQP